MARPRPLAFTLVELLVVVTIIVILLALLTPALDRAVYQAELAVCGGRLKVIASGANVYASDHKRYYPTRQEYFLQPAFIGHGTSPDTYLDMRPVLRRAYGSVNAALSCPLAGKVDYDRSTADSIYSSYNLWMGWRYEGERGMNRLGDRWTYKSNALNMLGSDRDLLNANGSQSSHPDDKGVLANEVFQDQTSARNGLLGFKVRVTIAWWINDARPDRGATDLNFASADGAVRRVNGVRWEGNEDAGIVQVPVYHTGQATLSDGIFVLR